MKHKQDLNVQWSLLSVLIITKYYMREHWLALYISFQIIILNDCYVIEANMGIFNVACHRICHCTVQLMGSHKSWSHVGRKNLETHNVFFPPQTDRKTLLLEQQGHKEWMKCSPEGLSKSLQAQLKMHLYRSKAWQQKGFLHNCEHITFSSCTVEILFIYVFVKCILGDTEQINVFTDSEFVFYLNMQRLQYFTILLLYV